jgi:hypothetical protein
MLGVHLQFVKSRNECKNWILASRFVSISTCWTRRFGAAMLPEYAPGISKFKHQDKRTHLFKKKDLQLTHRLHKRKITARECYPASKIYSSDRTSPRRFRYLVQTQNIPDHGVGTKTDVANYIVAICDHRPEKGPEIGHAGLSM